MFLQFLDCLFQVVSQFPGAFEFTDTLIVFLADHVSSCLYGNFLGTALALVVKISPRQIVVHLYVLLVILVQGIARRSASRRWTCAC